jgi:hypothetical protein
MYDFSKVIDDRRSKLLSKYGTKAIFVKRKHNFEAVFAGGRKRGSKV